MNSTVHEQARPRAEAIRPALSLGLPDDAARALGTCVLFEGLPDEVMAWVRAAARRQPCRRGSLLWSGAEGPDGSIYVVESGCIRHYRHSREGHELTLASLYPGDVLGLGDGILAAEADEYAQAIITDAVVYRLPRSRTQAMMASSAAFAWRAGMVLSRQLAEAYSYMEDLEGRDVGARLARVLARFVTGTGQTVVEATHDELAGLAGTNREKVTKELQVLRAAELIEYTPRSRRIRVLDVERLTAL